MVHNPSLLGSFYEIPGQGFKPEPLSYLFSLAPRWMDRRKLALLLLCKAPWQSVIVRSSTEPTHLTYYSVLPVLRLLDDSLPASSTVTQCGQPGQHSKLTLPSKLQPSAQCTSPEMKSKGVIFKICCYQKLTSSFLTQFFSLCFG